VDNPLLLRVVLSCLLAITLPASTGAQQVPLAPVPGTAPAHGAVLPAAEVNKFLPDSLFFRGQRLLIETRNSEGVLFPDGMYLLAALVDTSGHATGANSGSFACLLAEVPLDVNGHKLKPGIYGIDLDDHRRFVMMDIAAHRVFVASSERDSDLARPRPLQFLFDSRTQSYRLYLERSYVSISRRNRSAR
jgi:hypothetical protein